MRHSLRIASIAFALSTLALPVSAQTLEEEQASTTTTTTTTSSSDTPRTVESGHQLGDDQAAMEEANPRPTADDGISARLDATDHDYFSVGFLARGVVIPDFVLNWFAHFYGPSPLNAGMGGYFAFRRNGLNVIAEIWYAGFGGQGYFRGSGADPETDYFNSQLGVVFGNFVFQWAVPVNEWFSVDIGIGLGLGGVVGNMQRQDATTTTPGRGYSICPGPGLGAPGYCPPDMPTAPGNDGTYHIRDNTTNPFGFGSGLVPPIFPWLDIPRVTARFTPIRQLVIRVDLGYSIYAFNWGGSIGYQF